MIRSRMAIGKSSTSLETPPRIWANAALALSEEGRLAGHLGIGGDAVLLRPEIHGRRERDRQRGLLGSLDPREEDNLLIELFFGGTGGLGARGRPDQGRRRCRRRSAPR